MRVKCETNSYARLANDTAESNRLHGVVALENGVSLDYDGRSISRTGVAELTAFAGIRRGRAWAPLLQDDDEAGVFTKEGTSETS